MVDNLMFYGRGAGKLPTASAVVGDIVDIVRSPEYNSYFTWGDGDESAVIPYEDVEAKFFIRITEDKKDSVKAIFGDVEIIKGVSDYGFVSPLMSVKALDEKLAQLGSVVSKMRLFK
jgi:homoserine dehydrogenase